MSPSKSRMKIVLKVKQHQEKKAQSELAEIGKEKERAEERLDAMETTKETAMTDAGQTTKATATELVANRAFLHALSHEIGAQQEKLETIENEQKVKRLELVARSQEKRMVEKLDAKRDGEEARESEKKRQRLIDMLAQRIRFEF